MKKKSIVMTAAAVMMTASIAIGGTLAYLQANASLKNAFTMGGPDGKNDFTITLDEATLSQNGKDDNDNWGWVAAETRTYKGNTYKDIVPNVTLPKDPTVTNTGAYDAWVQIDVEVPMSEAAYAAWKEATKTTNAIDLAKAMFTGTPEGFTGMDASYADGKLVVSYPYDDVVLAAEGEAPAGMVTAFTHVIIPNFDNDQWSAVTEDLGDDGFVVNVSAKAIQTSPLFNNVADAMGEYVEETGE
ncbi:SipW-dependent-type signal peptide-containing protein [Intestinibacillus massiliensis]|uniref:SipW-dependent-type signal peptide-containing protein n=1 Tax=Intestinibacillus massiliensis TaxID=1871029 RepID=UPI000B355A10|nr:SipW-dependent-type signal peptide-containing protein [Intestinibacillus massiliensis]